MIRNFITAVVLFSTILLGGCATRYYSGVYLHDQVDAPLTPPKIINGQTAYIYYSEGLNKNYSEKMTSKLASAWEKTSLFRRVVASNNRTPSTQGFYIHTHCNSYYTDEGQALLTIASLATLGALPNSVGRDQYYCDTSVYQNGSQISGSNSNWDFRWLFGSFVVGATLPQTEILEKGYSDAVQHIVAKDLIALKKAYP